MQSNLKFTIRQMEKSESKIIVDLVNLAYADVQFEFFNGLDRTNREEVEGIFLTGIWLGAFSTRSNELIGVGAIEFKEEKTGVLSMLAAVKSPESEGVGDEINTAHLDIAKIRDLKTVELNVVGRRDQHGSYEKKLFNRSDRLGFKLMCESDFAKVFPQRAKFQKIPLVVTRFFKQI